MIRSIPAALLAAIILFGGGLAHGQEDGAIRLNFQNNTGGVVDGLRLRFDRPLDATTPFELTVPGATLAPLIASALSVDGLELVFSGGILPAGFTHPAGLPGVQLEFHPDQDGPPLQISDAAWQTGGVDSHALHILQLVNPATSAADRLEIQATDTGGTPLPAIGLAHSPDPFTLFGCAGISTGLGPFLYGIDWPCNIAAQTTAPWVVLTMVDTTRAARLSVSWFQGTARIASSLWIETLPGPTAPSLGLTLEFDRPIAGVQPPRVGPYSTLLGIDTSSLRFCGGAAATGSAIGPVEFITTAPGATDLQLLTTTWREVSGGAISPDPLIPDAIYLSFDEGDSTPGAPTAQLALPSPGPSTATVAEFTTNGPGQFGSALLGRSGPGRVETGLASNLGTGSWTVMYWVDLSQSNDATARHYVFSDFTAMDWRGDINFNTPGNLRLASSAFGDINMANAITATEPHHVAHVYDAGTGDISTYIDASLHNTTTVGAIDLGVGTNTWVGAHESYGGNWATGSLLDEFRLYRRPLSSSEVELASRTFVLGLGAPASFETNDAQASMSLDGAEGQRHCPVVFHSDTRSRFDVTLDSVHWGFPYDIVVGAAPLLAAEDGGLTLFDGQIVNLDLRAPSTIFALGGFVQPFTPTQIPVLPTVPLKAGLQFAVGSPINPTGIALSAPTQLEIVAIPPTASIVVRATGNNSYNPSTSPPFWTVTHNGTNLPLVGVRIAADSGAEPRLNGMRFDLDQPFAGNGGIVLFGDGTAPCLGTYRGTDLDVGLVYDAMNTYINFDAGTGCLGGNCGFISTPDPSLGAEDTFDVAFRFAPGQFFGNTFVFDLDTDGGPGVNGRDMAGMTVTIQLVGGTTISGVMEADPDTPNSSFVAF